MNPDLLHPRQPGSQSYPEHRPAEGVENQSLRPLAAEHPPASDGEHQTITAMAVEDGVKLAVVTAALELRAQILRRRIQVEQNSLNPWRGLGNQLQG